MVDEYNIKDLYSLKLHAEQNGSSIGEYIRRGRFLGLNDRQIIQTASNSQTLEEAVAIKIKSEKKRRISRVASHILSGLAVAYALNFGVNVGIAKSNLPEGFQMRQRTIAEQQQEIETYWNDIKDLPKTDFMMLKLIGMGTERQWNVVRQEPAIWEYNARMKKAFNPFA